MPPFLNKSTATTFQQYLTCRILQNPVKLKWKRVENFVTVIYGIGNRYVEMCTKQLEYVYSSRHQKETNQELSHVLHTDSKKMTIVVFDEY